MGKPGFILNLDMDQEKLVTDASWDCFLAKSWQPGQYKRWFLRSLQEEFDARLYPYGWDTSDFKPRTGSMGFYPEDQYGGQKSDRQSIDHKRKSGKKFTVGK